MRTLHGALIPKTAVRWVEKNQERRMVYINISPDLDTEEILIRDKLLCLRIRSIIITEEGDSESNNSNN